ncbi:phosphoribosyltransferase-like protein [Arenibacter palladensis]|uniref:phosphoribosyltransferase-like protein n=1 Tax=Arenibacter palladensis TaxID=237373 RepID=UPI0026E16E72|nr:hypothetical protein [Arenibacter palladensis]MDO6601659.1 hypothetical protein [Arenibacter palladensis]
MEQIAEAIYEIIKDYQCDYDARKFEITVEHIINWADQFGKDGLFVLEELLYFLPSIYISKEKAKNLLRESLTEIMKFYRYRNMIDFVKDSHFFDTQKPYKSQPEILEIIDDILRTEYMIEYKDFTDSPKSNYIYFDDILGTGGSVFKDLKTWLSTKEDDEIENYKAVLADSKKIAVILFCYHQLGYGNMQYRLMKEFDDAIKKKLIIGADYIIENQVKWPTQNLNCLYPIKEQSVAALEYLAKLEEVYERVPAFRPANMPKNETFFSSPENRLRLESIFLEKGLELLAKIKSENPDKRKRPLGDTVRSHRTFGTGTLFFTWRNISNTCPLVFWWDVPGHDWTPLFCVKNRGL